MKKLQRFSYSKSISNFLVLHYELFIKHKLFITEEFLTKMTHTSFVWSNNFNRNCTNFIYWTMETFTSTSSTRILFWHGHNIKKIMRQFFFLIWTHNIRTNFSVLICKDSPPPPLRNYNYPNHYFSLVNTYLSVYVYFTKGVERMIRLRFLNFFE